MEYKSPIRYKISISLMFSLLTISGISQNCYIEKSFSMPFYFNKNGKVTDLSSKIRFIDSNNIQIMLINFYGQIQNKTEAFYMSIDSTNSYKILGMNADSLFFSKSVQNSKNYDFGFLQSQPMPKGFLVSNCDNIVSSHKKSALYVYHNASSRWVEYTSLDGHLEESLCTNIPYSFLNKCYQLLYKIFKDNKIEIK